MRYDHDLAAALAPLCQTLEDCNDHTGVQLVIARCFGDIDHRLALSNLIGRQERQGHLDKFDVQDRRRVSVSLGEYVRLNHPDAVQPLWNYLAQNV